MAKNSFMGTMKSITGGVIAGAMLGYAGRMMTENKPKMKKKAHKAMNTFGQIIDTAQYMFK